MKKVQSFKTVACVFIFFFASRLLFYYAGIRFDDSSLPWHWQFIDPDLLRNHLAESLYYLHSQPPLFQLYLGLVLKLFPGHEPWVFALSFFIFGLSLAYCLFWTMCQLGVSGRLSSFLTIFFIVSPACVLFENYLFYTYPVTLLLGLSTVFWVRFVKTGTSRDGLLCFSLLALIVLTRSLFHLFWFLLLWVSLLLFLREKWKKVVWVGLIPFLMVLSLYAKNGMVFGNFAGSSWLGMNFSKITTLKLSVEERQELVQQGKISPFVFIPLFSPLSVYREYFPPWPATGIAVLDQDKKSTGYRNYNNIAYLDISKQYMKDALTVLGSHPRAFLKGLSHAYFYYFLPASDYVFLEENRNHIKVYDRIFNILFYGQIQMDEQARLKKAGLGRKLLNIGFFMVLGYSFLLFYGLIFCVYGLSHRVGNKPLLLSLSFICLNILYVTVAGNAFEVGENNRFRFLIDPFFIILLGVFLTYRFKRIQNFYGPR